MVSCAHGNSHVPSEFASIFDEMQMSDDTMCEYGARQLFENIAPSIADYAELPDVSHLIVDVDGSISDGTAFSEYTQHLSAKQAGQIVRDYYLPYLMGFEERAEDWIAAQEAMLLIDIHTFEPIVQNIPVGMDIDLVFCHTNNEERSFALRLKRAFEKRAPWLRVRFNALHKVEEDSFVQHMRDMYGRLLRGIEISVGQNVIFPEGIRVVSEVICDVAKKWSTDSKEH